MLLKYKSRLFFPKTSPSLVSNTSLSKSLINCNIRVDIINVMICHISCFLNVVRLGGQVPVAYTAPESSESQRTKGPEK